MFSMSTDVMEPVRYTRSEPGLPKVLSLIVMNVPPVEGETPYERWDMLVRRRCI